MSWFSFSKSKQTQFKPDYRDTILYNGETEYVATGKIVNDKIEFKRKESSNELIYLNTNLSADQYIEYHNKFDIIRNKDNSDFAKQGMFMDSTDEHGNYIPTGRIFRSKMSSEQREKINQTVSTGDSIIIDSTQDDEMILWELMRLNDPNDVTYMGIPISTDDLIIGPNALKQKVNSTTEYFEFTEEIADEWNSMVELAVSAKRDGRYNESLKIWEEFENKYSAIALYPRHSAGKGKVLILLGKTQEAKNEFLKCINYFVKHENSIINSDDELTRNNCLGAIEHIGFCVDEWDDANDYLNGIAGKKQYTNMYYTGLRILRGLKVINENGLWCNTFDQMKSNVESRL